MDLFCTSSIVNCEVIIQTSRISRLLILTGSFISLDSVFIKVRTCVGIGHCISCRNVHAYSYKDVMKLNSIVLMKDLELQF